ncbi:hypothetical protein KSF_061340 [Reticulibacter mediterranei]|uniref:Helicase HerA central domain-containing protein n=1 Tax=Reticulibacter mediterranei TaxID=2778369 RepID=A0A8J3IKC7_9CHLR|nr:DUF87 domain-containing protein [Reticulibacter mediterranei]GHO96086.1 hypothetical protein KSF_061340 [Reticulibacter mediterranei]
MREEEPQDQQHTEDKKTYPLQQSAAWAGGTFLASLPFDIFGHFGPTGLLVGGLASYVAWRHGPEVYEQIAGQVRGMLPSPAPSEPPAEQPGRSWLERAFGHFPEAEAQPKEGEAQELPATPEPEAPATHQQSETWEEDWYDRDPLDEEDEVTLPQQSGTRFTFSQVLSSGFTPSLHKLYLGRLTDGSPVYVAAKDLCHVALAGNTGGGKSSLMRLLMAQLCHVGVRVLLLNPHYMRYDRDAGEDWTPFDPCLNKPPLECANYPAIKQSLQWMVEMLLPRRIARARDGQPIGKPFFVVIDELPAIVAEVKEAPGYIAKLLREGRKYGLFLIVASQDFLVKTTGMDGGGVRKCFRTAMYVGGDPTTAGVLLGDAGGKLPENDLGKGTIMLRCAVTKHPVQAHVPYVDNESLYHLLGPSTFVAPVSQQVDDLPHAGNEQQAVKVSDLTLEQLMALINRLPEVDPTDARYGGDDEQEREQEEPVSPPQNVTPLPTPVLPEKGPRAEDIDLAAAIALWNSGYNSERKLMKAFRLTQHQAGRLIERIKAQAGQGASNE